MSNIKTPKNITIVAVISIVLAGLALISSVGFLLVKGPGILTMLDTRLMTDAMLMKPSTSLMLSLILLLAVVISSVMMLKGKRSGWIAYITAVGILCGSPLLIHALSRPFIFNVITLAGVILIVTVSRKDTREYFAG